MVKTWIWYAFVRPAIIPSAEILVPGASHALIEGVPGATHAPSKSRDEPEENVNGNTEPANFLHVPETIVVPKSL